MPRLDSFDRHLAAIQPLLGEWGYLAVFVFIFIEGIGIPAPGQTLLMAGALLASRGELALGPLVATALAAAALGNAAGFEIGRRGGRPLLLRFARGDRLARIEAIFRRSDAALVSLGRFVDGARQLNGIAAGALGMDGQRFLRGTCSAPRSGRSSGESAPGSSAGISTPSRARSTWRGPFSSSWFRRRPRCCSAGCCGGAAARGPSRGRLRRMAGEPHLLDIELTTAGVPHARYAALRRSTPVCWQEAPEAGGYWAILKHADVQHVSKTPRLFSAEAKGMQLVDYTDQLPTLLSLDPPRHSEIRRRVLHAFAPRVVRRLEARMREVVRASFAEVAARARCDFVQDRGASAAARDRVRAAGRTGRGPRARGRVGGSAGGCRRSRDRAGRQDWHAGRAGVRQLRLRARPEARPRSGRRPAVTCCATPSSRASRSTCPPSAVCSCRSPSPATRRRARRWSAACSS